MNEVTGGWRWLQRILDIPVLGEFLGTVLVFLVPVLVVGWTGLDVGKGGWPMVVLGTAIALWLKTLEGTAKIRLVVPFIKLPYLWFVPPAMIIGGVLRMAGVTHGD